MATSFLSLARSRILKPIMASAGRAIGTRARRSTADARVTLYSLAPDAGSVSASSTTTTTPVRREDGQGRARVKDEAREESPLTDLEEDAPPKKKRRKAEQVKKEGTPRKAKPIQLALDKPHPAPPRWEEAYSLIKAQRATIVAPVDTMGCDEAGSHDPAAVAHLPPRSEKDKRLSVLISLMLSSQTKDEVTAAAVLNLRLKLGGMTVNKLCDASVEDIHSCINKVGFWRRKTEYIKEAVVTLRDKYDGDIPRTLGAHSSSDRRHRRSSGLQTNSSLSRASGRRWPSSVCRRLGDSMLASASMCTSTESQIVLAGTSRRRSRLSRRA